MDEDQQSGGNGEYDPLHYLGFLPGAGAHINLLKQTFYEKLVGRGLVYMYNKGYDVDPDSPILKSVEEGIQFEDDGGQTKNPKKVLVVGAGMSGLAAAYELKRAGHEVGEAKLAFIWVHPLNKSLVKFNQVLG